MVPKFIILLLFFGIVVAFADDYPKVHIKPFAKRNFTYRYSTSRRNNNPNNHGHHTQFNVGKHIEGNILVKLPEGQSISDVQYTADSKGFHPIVRLSTKNNHSEVTSHFALGQSAVERLSEQNESSNSDDSTPEGKDDVVNRYRTTAATQANYFKDSIVNVLSTLFPNGIPSPPSLRNSISTSSTSSDFDNDDDDNVEGNTSSDERIFPFRENFKEDFNRQQKDISDWSRERIVNNSFSRKLPQSQHNRVENLVSDEEVLLINDAVESYTSEGDGGKSQILSDGKKYSNEIDTRSMHRNNRQESIYPFQSPIIVGDINQNDNLVSSSQQESKSFSQSSPNAVESKIPIGQEKPHPKKYDSDREINLEIVDRELSEAEIFRQGLLKAASSQDLDSFHRIVEESFSRSQDFTSTEAPSRTFLREFSKEKLSNSKNSRLDDTEDYESNPSQEIERSGRILHDNNQNQFTPHYLTHRQEDEDDEDEDEDEEDHNTTTLPTTTARTIIKPTTLRSRSRGKTFVEIQRALNIQNLLIKEDADSIERHEEYLQPLASGHRLTRIESKFMKEKPIEIPKKRRNQQMRTPITVSIQPSIEYTIEGGLKKEIPQSSQLIDLKANYSSDMEQENSPKFSSDDSEDKIVQESQHLNTKVDFNKIEDFSSRYNDETENFQYSKPNLNDFPSSFKDESQNFQYSKYTRFDDGKDFDKPYPFEKPPEKIFENPIENNYFQEKETPVKEFIEKIVEKPVEVERIIEKPVHVPHIVPVDRFVEIPIHIPYPVREIIEVEKLVETKVPVHIEKFIDRPVPVPVEKIVNRPYPVEKIVEKIVDRPVPIHVPVKVPFPIPFPYLHNTQKATNYQPEALQKFYTDAQNLQSSYLENFRHYQLNQLTEAKQLPQTSAYIKPVPSFDDNRLQANGIPEQSNIGSGNLKDDYYGPVPVETQYSHWGGGQHYKRSSDFGRNLRMEYGFKPPLIPSIEIDDQGYPVNRNKET